MKDLLKNLMKSDRNLMETLNRQSGKKSINLTKANHSLKKSQVRMGENPIEVSPTVER